MNTIQTCTLHARWGLAGALLALGSLAGAGCGNGSSSPADARPPEARPPDARPPADAGRPPDADPPPVDAARLAACTPDVDALEPNDTPATALLLEPSGIYDNPAWVAGSWELDACLGQANQDWYRIESSQIPFETDENFRGTATMHLDLEIDGASVCRWNDGCDVAPVPAIPENTVRVDVYRASTMELVVSETDAAGVIELHTSDEAFADDLLIRVFGPAEALYRYRLHVSIDVLGSEDECEC